MPVILSNEAVNHFSMSTLKHLALVRTAIIQWSQFDISTLTEKLYFLESEWERQRRWQDIESEVTTNVGELPLPKTLKQDVLCLIKPIGLQIFRWIVYHVGTCQLDTSLPKELQWTQVGTIDKEKTIKLWIEDQQLDIVKRYKLACLYCLEDNIQMLWDIMPESQRISLYSKKDPVDFAQHELMVIWAYDINNDIIWIDNIIREMTTGYPSYEYALICSVLRGNEIAVEYFLRKLSHQEKETYLVPCGRCAADIWSNSWYLSDTPKEYYADVLHFLWRQMKTEKEKSKLIIDFHRGLLKSFLEWPWQSFFMETAKQIFPFLPEPDFSACLEDIVNKIKDGYRDFNYRSLFTEFWKQSSSTHKRYIIEKVAENKSLLLAMLFQIEDRQNILLILNYGTPSEKVKIIFSPQSRNIIQELAFNDKWDLLEFFIRECLSSREEIIDFENMLESSFIFCCFAKREKRFVQRKLSGILDNLIKKM